MLALLVFGAHPLYLHGQGVEDLVAPGGTLLFDFFPSFHSFGEVFGPTGERLELGSPFEHAAVGSDLLPQLQAPESALRALLDSDVTLNVGATRSELRGHEARFPMRAAWGVTDRITVGAMVPVVRRRLEAGISFAPSDANVGANPFRGGSGNLMDLLVSMDGALDRARQAVEEVCEAEGTGAAECVEGQELISSGERLLDGLPGVLQDSPVAPLEDSPAGVELLSWVQSLRAEIEDLGVPTFEDPLLLPTSPFGEEGFRSEFVAPAWGPNRPPLDSWPGIPELGDIEFQLSALLFDRALGDREPGKAAPSARIRSAAAIVYRLGTQQPDTLRDYFEGETPRGHSGLRIRSVTEVDVGARASAGIHLEVEDVGAAEVLRRVASPDDPFNPFAAREIVRWTPGRIIAVETVPRLRLTQEFSIAARYRYFMRSGDRYEALDGSQADPGMLLPAPEVRTHRAGGEISYSTLEAHEASGAVMPFIVRLRLERTVAGSGERVPAGTRIEAGFRFFVSP